MQDWSMTEDEQEKIKEGEGFQAGLHIVTFDFLMCLRSKIILWAQKKLTTMFSFNFGETEFAS